MLHDLLHLMRNKDVNIKFLFYMMVTLVIGDHWIVHDFLLQSKHKNDYNLFDTPLLDSSLRNDLRNLNDFFNDLLDDR